MITYPRYRAWDKEYSHMYANAYPFEHLVYVEVVKNSPDAEILLSLPALHRLEVNDKLFTWIPATEVELMEYLPFRDKAGKRICEGDIVAGSNDLNANYVRCIVRTGHTRTEGSDHCYAEEYYGVYLEGTVGLMDDLLEGRMYILGNVYENPELLSKTQ